MKLLPVPPWLRRAGVAFVGLLVIAVIATTWMSASVLGREFLEPRDVVADADIEVLAVGEGRIVLTRTEQTQTDGIWGLIGADAYGQVSSVVQVAGDEVERTFRPLSGAFVVGDEVRFDQYAYTGDPESAHGMSFEEVLIPGELGLYPAWLVDGDRDTWVVVVHGSGRDERKQALRLISTLETARYPVLVISYRNDQNAPASPGGTYGWGLEEWRDLEAALEFGKNRGADDFVVLGYGMGATITAMFLHESDLISDVRGVIFDSPVLDLETAAIAALENRSIPGVIAGWAKALARVRFGIEWDELDQLARANQFDMPILLMHGSRDGVEPVAVADAFAEARPDLVSYERFDGADHEQLWNTNPQRYERAVMNFLERVAAAG